MKPSRLRAEASVRVVCIMLLLSACGRSELFGAPSDGGGALPGSAGCDGLVTRAADAELLERWNQAIDSVQPLKRDFYWLEVSSFPHPTYRLGDAIAYAEFSAALVAFWRAGDNVDFVRCNALFDKSYPYGSTSGTQRLVRLRPLTAELSTSALVPVERQRELQSICALIGC